MSFQVPCNGDHLGIQVCFSKEYLYTPEEIPVKTHTLLGLICALQNELAPIVLLVVHTAIPVRMVFLLAHRNHATFD